MFSYARMNYLILWKVGSLNGSKVSEKLNYNMNLFIMALK